MFTCASGCFCVTNQKPWQSINTFLQISHFFSMFLTFLIRRLEEKGKKRRIKGKIMVQYISLLWYNSFVNRQQLPLLCEKIGATALALPGLVAGWLADKIIQNL